MRKWLCVGAIVVLSVSPLACGSQADQGGSQADQDKATAAAQSFFQDIGNKDYSRACDLSTISHKCEQLLSVLAHKYSFDFPKATNSKTSVKTSGDTGQVQIESDGRTYIAYMQNVHGDWKVQWPAVSP
jgi:hypothetical protein